MKRVLIFAPYSLNPPHFETGLELAQRHLDTGDEVVFVGCSSGLPACDLNPGHRLDVCLRCVKRHAAGRLALEGTARWIPLQHFALTAAPPPPKDFPGLDEVRAYREDGFDAGYAALSSTISVVREPSPQVTGNHGELLRRFLQASVFTYRAARVAIRELKPDVCYVYNGRFSICRAFFRAASAEGVPCRIHELGATINQYCLFDGHLPHDFARVRGLIARAWADPMVTLEEKERIGHLFYAERVGAIPQSWHSFVAQQKRGRLPEGWTHGMHNVVLYNSSEDEFAAIGDNEGWKLYGSQVEGIVGLVESFRARPDIHLWVRVHPNLRAVENSQTRALRALAQPNLTVVSADSDVSSYAMLHAAMTVATFGSTMGMEATYWNKPSVLLASTFYSGIGGAWEPGSHEEAVRLLASPALGVASKEAALKYGYYLRSRGERFKYYEPEGIFEGRFRGRRIKEHVLHRLIGYGVAAGPLWPIERVLRALRYRFWLRRVFRRHG